MINLRRIITQQLELIIQQIQKKTYLSKFCKENNYELITYQTSLLGKIVKGRQVVQKTVLAIVGGCAWCILYQLGKENKVKFQDFTLDRKING